MERQQQQQSAVVAMDQQQEPEQALQQTKIESPKLNPKASLTKLTKMDTSAVKKRVYKIVLTGGKFWIFQIFFLYTYKRAIP